MSVSSEEPICGHLGPLTRAKVLVKRIHSRTFSDKKNHASKAKTVRRLTTRINRVVMADSHSANCRNHNTKSSFFLAISMCFYGICSYEEKGVGLYLVCTSLI